MRCAILALAAGLLMVTGSSTSHAADNNGCTTCSQAHNYQPTAYNHASGYYAQAQIADNCGCRSCGHCAQLHRGCSRRPGCNSCGSAAGCNNGGCNNGGCHHGLGGCGGFGLPGCNGIGAHGMFGHHGQGRGCQPIGPGGPYMGPSGPPTSTYGYPYYTIRGPRDFLMANPPTIGR